MHNINIEFVLALFILGAAVLAFIYHAVLYFFSRDRFLIHYLIYLFFTGLFLYSKTGLIAVQFGINSQTYIMYAFREAIQIIYLCCYFNFIIHAIGISGREKPFLFRFWPATAVLLLLYAALFSISKLYFPLEDYTIPFVMARVFIFVITGMMLYQSFRLKEIKFQLIILIGCTVYLLCGLISFVVNLEPDDSMLIYPLEWLMIGSFIDIIFFSVAIGYRNKKTWESLNLSLLEEANKVIEKQAELENERNRIAADMHDDLGSGLTKITYLSQMAVRNDDAGESLLKIKTTASALVKNMSELIWVMKEENNTLEDLTSYIRAFASEYFESNHIALRFLIGDMPEGIVVNGTDRRNIFLSVKECCHNIVKHAAATQASMHIEYTGFLSIVIADNGKGIPDAAARGKTGNGLQNMAYRMTSIKGTMEILNKNGTEVRFMIPVGRG
ncbi:7TM diverse intracellular signaling domain-containing protein [Flavobacterium sp.]|uniref:sensor histidine kinase n=1 Tax=Flavobacterium sp. TaxID=239 RepID=UPI00261E8A1C|nr:7TM diverse intracellular signaling domain-containing protein [Flavobacterium sp.]